MKLDHTKKHIDQIESVNKKSISLNNNQKEGVARLFADLIKADKVITPEEIDYFKKIQKKYSINSKSLSKSVDMSFADALNHLMFLSRTDNKNC